MCIRDRCQDGTEQLAQVVVVRRLKEIEPPNVVQVLTQLLCTSRHTMNKSQLPHRDTHIMPTTLYTKQDAQCEKLVMVTNRTKLTTVATADLPWQNFSKTMIWDKIPEGNTFLYFGAYPNFHKIRHRIVRRKPQSQNQHNLFSYFNIIQA